jgi:dTDP-4-dehydrorhamnose reductase
VKILLFGGSGQLGHELRKRAEDLHFELVSPVTKEVDITDANQVISLIESVRPAVVINSAAYTAVDKAEEEQERAFAINATAVRTLARACKGSGARFIHVSTDYVFDGLLGRPLREDDPANPVSVYGRSKWQGEEYVREELGEDGIIVRTQALYGQKGVNFVQTMLRLFREREVLKIVNDQWVSPTWAGWLAEVILDLVRLPAKGTFHASCDGVVSWYDFASEIQRLSLPHFQGQAVARLEPTTAAELNRPAKRPVFSAFDTTKLQSTLRRPIMPWQRGLREYLTEVGIISPSV